MKKSILFLGILGLMTHVAFAQQYRTAFPSSSNKVLRFAVTNGDVTVKTHNDSDILIRPAGDDWDWEDPRESERAQGLKMISADGEDNTDIGLYQTTEGDVLMLTQLGKSQRDFEILVPKDASVQLVEDGWHGSSDFVIEGVGGEIEVTANNGDVVLRQISGPLVVNAMNGDIDIVFSKVSQSSPMSVNATNGAIDVTMPADAKGDLKLRSMNGEIFSDLDIKIERDSSHWNTSLLGKLNGGGVKIDLSAMNGNIFLRKK